MESLPEKEYKSQNDVITTGSKLSHGQWKKNLKFIFLA
jgi:hypothetical protein